jgi:hypothetical protein
MPCHSSSACKASDAVLGEGASKLTTIAGGCPRHSGLEFRDGSFDVVTSTLGVMFVGRPEDAARELVIAIGPAGSCLRPLRRLLAQLFLRLLQAASIECAGA